MNTDMISFNNDSLEGRKLVLQVNAALERLERNKDFQLLYKTYTQNFLLDRASLFGSDIKERIDRTRLIEYQIGVANFISFLHLVKDFKAEQLENEKAELQAKQEKSQSVDETILPESI